MNAEQIREIVRITIDELTKRKLIKTPSYQNILKVVDKQLYSFFDNKGCNHIAYILRELSDDKYIDIIFLQYRDRRTIEWIAERLDVDVSTIKRNKKRLIMAIYETLEE